MEFKKWFFGKLFIFKGASCSGCSKPNLADIVEPDPKPKPKIPIHTNPSPNICHITSSSSNFDINGVQYSSMNDLDFDQDDQTSTTFSIDIGSLSPRLSSYQNDDTNFSPKAEANSVSKVSSTCPEISGTLLVVKNLNDPFQENHTSNPFSTINIYSLSPPSSDKNDDINLSHSEVNSRSEVGTCSKIGDTTLDFVKNLDGPFQDNHTSTTFSIKTKSLSPPRSDQNEYTNLSQSEANSEFRVDSCPKISNTVAVFINSDDPFQDFKKSILQMIFEKEIYSSEDLVELLNCFLKLNSPSHHHIIIQAFMEILNDNGKIVSEGYGKKKQSLRFN
ncbi:hypothetical protein HAX54_030132 [Datura stramonium]|uniref:Transcription repressor n=1 Tax=Datura stramonium TaxID=4076 RepID=A0ABS8VA20_DATST|nr:hypothetical protein [Datura stramonium]